MKMLNVEEIVYPIFRVGHGVSYVVAVVREREDVIDWIKAEWPRDEVLLEMHDWEYDRGTIVASIVKGDYDLPEKNTDINWRIGTGKRDGRLVLIYQFSRSLLGTFVEKDKA